MAHTPMFRNLVRALQRARRENLKAEGKPLPLSKEETRWTRRGFVKAVLGGGAVLAAGSLPRPVKALDRWISAGKPKIAVIGGGIAGLNAAYQLQKRGLKATVYEASGRLGGRILSVTDAVGDGLVADLGGSFINTDHADMRALANEFGLRLFNRSEDAGRFPFPKTGYFFAGKARSEEEVAEKLRPLAQQIAADAALLDQDFAQFAPEFDRPSVAHYLDRHADKLPDPFIRTLIENSIRTEYGVESDQSSALQLLFLLPTVDGRQVEILGSSDEAFFIEGGSGQLIDSLGKALAGQIHTRMRLTKIESRRKNFLLTFNNHTEVTADYVIIAIPFTVLRSVALQIKLPAKLKRFIHEVDLGRNEKLIAGFREKFWRRSDGFVQEAWTDLGFSEIWEETQRQPGRPDGALTFFVGGQEVLKTQVGSAQFQGRSLINRLEDFLPGTKDAATDQFLRTRWSRSRFTQGGYTNFKPGQYMAFADFRYVEADDPAERQEVAVGNLVFAGEHLSDESYGYMNGGAQTGRLAAEVVVRLIEEASVGGSSRPLGISSVG
jgi:monoamine oxidase